MIWFALLSGCADCETSAEGCLHDVAPTPVEPYTPPVEDPTVTERLEVMRAQVDVLFVIDNSWATTSAQLDRASRNVPELFTALEDADADFHVGVVTSELSRAQGVLLGWTDSRERLQEWLREAAPRGADAGYGRLTAYRALETQVDQANAGFRRLDAELHILFVSGQDDLSVNPDATEFTSWARLEPERGGTVHAIAPIGSPSYERYTDVTGGQFADIDSEGLHYASILGELRPPRMYLGEIPADPLGIQVKLESVSPRIGVGQASVCIAPSEGCSLVYRASSNSLDWLEPPDVAVAAVVLTYESLH